MTGDTKEKGSSLKNRELSPYEKKFLKGTFEEQERREKRKRIDEAKKKRTPFWLLKEPGTYGVILLLAVGAFIAFIGFYATQFSALETLYSNSAQVSSLGEDFSKALEDNRNLYEVLSFLYGNSLLLIVVPGLLGIGLVSLSLYRYFAKRKEAQNEEILREQEIINEFLLDFEDVKERAKEIEERKNSDSQ